MQSSTESLTLYGAPSVVISAAPNNEAVINAFLVLFSLLLFSCEGWITIWIFLLLNLLIN